ncbi:hypothetical protein X770_30920 [Mesorhizobium sp. LSJC269B00]|nr:hypothetical protein X770_30920 [Mesorhizobium sp. LSJC269B00]
MFGRTIAAGASGYAAKKINLGEEFQRAPYRE